MDAYRISDESLDELKIKSDSRTFLCRCAPLMVVMILLCASALISQLDRNVDMKVKSRNGEMKLNAHVIFFHTATS